MPSRVREIFASEFLGQRYYRAPIMFSRLLLRIARRQLRLKEVVKPVVYFQPRHSGNSMLRVLVPSSIGRLGNGLVQLGSALSFARSRGLGNVVINSEFPLIENGFHQVDGMQVWVGDIRAPLPQIAIREVLGGPLLQGDWFYSSLSVNKGDISPGLQTASKLLKTEYRIGTPSREGLVIHYRVGDIFGEIPIRHMALLLTHSSN